MAGAWYDEVRFQGEVQAAIDNSIATKSAEDFDRNCAGHAASCLDHDAVAAPFAEPSTLPSAFRSLATGYFGTTAAEARDIANLHAQREMEEEAKYYEAEEAREDRDKEEKDEEREQELYDSAEAAAHRDNMPADAPPHDPWTENVAEPNGGQQPICSYHWRRRKRLWLASGTITFKPSQRTCSHMSSGR